MSCANCPKRDADPDTNAAYLAWLKTWATTLKANGKPQSDGCTHIADIHVHCCWQHDFCYQTGFDPYSLFIGTPMVISRRDADAMFRLCNQGEDVLGVFSPLAWWRWLGVRIFGRFFYSAPKSS